MILFPVFSSIALVSAVMVIRAKNPVHSVFFFILVFCNTSSLLLLLGLDFFAMIFLVVYIGAIAVLFLFVVMMLDIKIAEIHENVLRYLPVGGIIGLIFWLEIFVILDNDYIPILSTNSSTTYLGYTVYAGKIQSWTNLETLGNLIYTNYLVLFLVSSLILLVAMIGAIVLAMHKTTKVKRQDVFRQNAIDFQKTIEKIRQNKPKEPRKEMTPEFRYSMLPVLRDNCRGFNSSCFPIPLPVMVFFPWHHNEGNESRSVTETLLSNRSIKEHFLLTLQASSYFVLCEWYGRRPPLYPLK